MNPFWMMFLIFPNGFICHVLRHTMPPGSRTKGRQMLHSACVGGQAGGADGGQQPGNRADEQSRPQAAGPGLGRDDDRPALEMGVDDGVQDGGGAVDSRR